MKATDFVATLKLAHDVPNYYNHHFPKNLGYYDGERFSFDCWNMIKAILSGWTDNRTKGYYIHTDQLVTGDITGAGLLAKCTGRSKDFSQLKIAGTYLYIADKGHEHAGVYVGDFNYQNEVFNVVECTSDWASKVQYTYVNEKGERFLYKNGPKGRSWTEYGLLPWVEYSGSTPVAPVQIRGIDVSRYQGNIDWAKVKAAGVGFALIKMGGSDCGRYKDAYAEANYAAAKAAGMKIGCYYIHGRGFMTAQAGKADAEHFLSLISGKTFDYPCFSDLEIPVRETKAGNTDAVIAFCEALKASGRPTGIYASDISGFKERLDISRLSAYDKWVACYGSSPNYVKDYTIWQYSSSGSVDGINGRVDVDISYKDYSNDQPVSFMLWGADFSPVFDPEYYYAKYVDLQVAIGSDPSALWAHFTTFGMNEARQASAEFNVTAYKDRYIDLQAAYGDNLPMYYWHYCMFGKKEGRIAT